MKGTLQNKSLSFHKPIMLLATFITKISKAAAVIVGIHIKY